MNYYFKQKWDENVPIEWWKECRIELNKIIDVYNYWQIEGFSRDKAIQVLAFIEYGKQTIGSRDGGSGYLEELEDMERFVQLNS
jgi:hypothetical protein